jgi:hypothetical protein
MSSIGGLGRFLPASQDDAGNRIGLVYNFISVLLNYVAHYNMSTFKGEAE